MGTDRGTAKPQPKPVSETIRKGGVGHNPPPKDPAPKPVSGVDRPAKK